MKTSTFAFLALINDIASARSSDLGWPSVWYEEAEAKAVLKGRVVATGNPPGTQMYTPVKIPSVTVGSAKGMGTLGFNVKTKTLQRIRLDSSADISQDETVTKITT